MPTGIYKRSPEVIERLRKARLGKKLSEETKKKISESHKGKPSGMYGKNHSEETKKKIGTALKGNSHRKGKKHSDETREKLRISAKKHGFGGWNKGRKMTKESRTHLSNQLKGDKSYRWKGGITEKNRKIRSSLEYRLWREAVFKRDDYTCQECGKRGGKLEVDHIKPFATYPKLRLLISNGRTLCKFPCHKEKTRKDLAIINK